MCLTTIDKKTIKTSRKYLWKVFRITEEGIESQYWNFYHYYIYNRWYKSSKIRLPSLKSGSYPAGFHCFLTKKDALLWKNNSIVPESLELIKVKFKDIVASGTQGKFFILPSKSIKYLELPCLVVEQIKLVKPSNKG